MQSPSESAAAASSAGAESFLPRERLYMAIYSFAQIEAARIPITSQLNSTRAGCRILFRDSLASSTPISKISMDTARPERYSARPWPKGWPGSGALAAMRKPSSVTTEEPASERLLKASAVMATEPERVPAKNLPKNSSRFSPIPTAPQRIP